MEEFGGDRGIVWCVEGLDICKEQQSMQGLAVGQGLAQRMRLVTGVQ